MKKLIIPIVAFMMAATINASAQPQRNAVVPSYSAKEDFAMKEIKRRLVLDDFEYRLLVGCVNKARTMFIDENKPVEDVSALLLKIIDAPTKKIKIRS